MRLRIATVFSLFLTILLQKYVRGGDPKGKAPMDASSSTMVLGVTENLTEPSDLEAKSESELHKEACTLAENGQYQAAYDHFSYVITRNPTEPKYFYNRAFCSIRLEKFAMAIEDCEKALQIDPWSIKANFFLGSAYLELEEYNEAVIYLYRAYDSAKEQRKSFGDDIAFQLRLARRKKWRVREDERLAADNKLGLFPYLKLLMKEAKEEEIDKIMSAKGVDEETRSTQIKEIEQKFNEYLRDVTTILARADAKTKRRELPDYLSGRMNYKLLSDAVLTPTGDTFEKEDLLDHFRRFGHFDPLHPNTTLDETMLVPNLAMKDAAEAFKKENDWLEEFEQYVFDFLNHGNK